MGLKIFPRILRQGTIVCAVLLQPSELPDVDNIYDQQRSMINRESSCNFRNVRSAYYKRKEKQLEKWDNVRSLMVKCFVEACCLPEEKLCVLCEEQFATIRCLECGYGQYYCHGCASLIHRDRSIFHFLEEWKVGICILKVKGNQHRLS